jgi:hypothetical protein
VCGDEIIDIIDIYDIAAINPVVEIKPLPLEKGKIFVVPLDYKFKSSRENCNIFTYSLASYEYGKYIEIVDTKHKIITDEVSGKLSIEID